MSGFSSFSYSSRAAPNKMRHLHRLVRVGRGEGGVKGDAADVAAGNRKARKLFQIERIGRRFRGKNAAPDFRALHLVGKGKLHDKAQPPQERRVERFLHVRRENRETAIGLHPLQQVADFDICVAIVAVFHLAPFAEKRVGFVEEQHRAAFLGRVEHSPQILFGLADVLAHHGAEIDAEKIEPHFVREDLRGEGFAGAARAGEERAQAEAAAGLLGKTPVVVDPRALPQMLRDRLQDVHLRRGQDEVGPGRFRRDTLREILQPRTRVEPARVPQLVLRVLG